MTLSLEIGRILRTKCLNLVSLKYASSSSSSSFDFTKSVEEFRRNGVTILPLKVETGFVEKSKDICLNAWKDALARGKIIKGHDIMVGREHGFKEIVLRAPGRYDMQWKIDGNPHFLDKESILDTFLPFVHAVLGGEQMTKMDFNGCLFSLPGAKEQLWHTDGEHLYTSEDHFKLCGQTEVDFFRKQNDVDSILPAHCLNIFIPLVDVESGNGGTEFCLGSHFHTKFFSDDIVWQNSEWKERIGFKGDVMSINVNAGEVLAFDYRVLHRAFEHRGKEVRPVLYYTFTKRWFSDAMNFPDSPSLSQADDMVQEAQEEEVKTGDSVERWREHYPQLTDSPARIYCDGAAGSQTPDIVIRRMTDHLRVYGSSNLGGQYPTSQAVTRLVGEARQAGRDLLGPHPDMEIMFGYNCSNLMFHLSHAMSHSRVVGPGDNVLLSPACHDANIAPWLFMANNGRAETRWLPLMKDSHDHSTSDKIDIEMLDKVIDDKTKVISLALASNVTGRTHLEAVHRIVEIIKTMKQKPFLILDATHFIPHQCCHVIDLGADAVVSSAYKYFGPHLGVMGYNRQSFSRLMPTKVGVRFNSKGEVVDDLLYPGDAPNEDNCQISRWENGTPNYEGLAGFVGCVEYIASLNNDNIGDDRRASVVSSYQNIQKHELKLSERFLSKIKPLIDGEKV